MKKRDILLPALTTIIITGMVNFMSCASQNRAGEESYDDQIVSENTQPAEEVAENTVPEEGAAPTENKDTAAEESLKALSTDEQAAVDPTLEALGGDPAAQSLSAGEGEMTKVDESATPPLSDQALLDGATPEEPKNFANNDVQSEPAVDLPSEPLAPEVSTPPAAARTAYNGASVPKIPSKAIARKGASLNRFYFIRSGDTPNSVSQLIYGDSSKGSKLTSWNGGGWTAGKLIYYASPAEPNDGTMRSFYQERNVISTDYQVRTGDWLSRIASKNLGNAASWKEIAVVNGMNQADELEVGQKLAIYPRDLTPFAFGAQSVAHNETETNEPVGKENVAPPQDSFASNLNAQDPNATANNNLTPEPQAPIADPIPAPAPVTKKQSGQKMDINKLIEQNLFTIVIGAGLVILLLALSAINRRRRARANGDDFGGDEGFAAPPKLRRK